MMIAGEAARPQAVKMNGGGEQRLQRSARRDDSEGALEGVYAAELGAVAAEFVGASFPHGDRR
jgi:hypothetical protein